MRSGVVSARHVFWGSGERLARPESAFLVPVADLADRILIPIVPGDARLAVGINPLAVLVSERPVSTAIIVERDIEVVS